jgi:predicted secreted protein
VETIRLKPGESHTIVLPGLGSAGYQWSVEVVDPQVAVAEEILHLRDEVTVPVAGSLDQRFRVKAIAPGQTPVRFVQKRRFGSAQPRAFHEISVVVLRD